MEADKELPANHDVEHARSNDKLSIFREQIGITDVLTLGPPSSKRSARNVGVYKRVCSEERHARIEYYASATLINMCLILQIIFGAVLTALGAASGSHTAITAFGAANTVIASLLSFTKGQGLPNRLRQYQNTLRKVREYIEQRERDFSQLDCKLDLDHEIKTIVEMYENTRQNDENNDPNAYHNPLDMSTKGQAVSSEVTKKSSSFGPNALEQHASKLAGKGRMSDEHHPAASDQEYAGQQHDVRFPHTAHWES